jgi:hypothetical protein
MHRQVIIGAALISFAATPTFGQSFNIDMGNGNPVPSAGFGGAANQPGTWNQFAVTGPIPLVDLAGAATAVTCRCTAAAGWLGFSSNNPSTTGDDELLLDDISDGLQGFDIVGLQAGTYEVYTYVWAPDVPGISQTNVTVTPPGGNMLLGGTSVTAPPPYTSPGHFVLHTVTITAGQTLNVNLTQGASFVTCNGIQLKLQGGGPACDGDADGDGDTDVDDLIAVILDWGCVGAPGVCDGDVNNSGATDVDDLIAVILDWGCT